MTARPRARGRRLLRLALPVALLAVLASCKVDVKMAVRVAENGSGAVQVRFVLDDEAVAAVGGDVAESLRVDDLVQAGWEVDVDEDGSGAEVFAERGFATPEELTAVIDQLSGDAGPFEDFRLRRERSLFRTSFEFAGRVDLEGGVGPSALEPDDATVASEIERQGIEIEELRRYLRERLDPGFSFEVLVAMPGDGSDNAPGSLGGEPRWQPEAGAVTDLRASSSELDLDRVVLVALGIVLAVLAAAIYAGWRFRRDGDA